MPQSRQLAAIMFTDTETSNQNPESPSARTGRVQENKKV